eukprot:5101926-Prymnesium_polylepis.2
MREGGAERSRLLTHPLPRSPVAHGFRLQPNDFMWLVDRSLVHGSCGVTASRCAHFFIRERRGLVVVRSSLSFLFVIASCSWPAVWSGPTE